MRFLLVAFPLLFGSAVARASQPVETVKLVSQLSFSRCEAIKGYQVCELPDVAHPQTVEVKLDIDAGQGLHAGYADFDVVQDGMRFTAVFTVR
jgi:hypothetical protein